MNNNLIVIRPLDPNMQKSERFINLMAHALEGRTYRLIQSAELLASWVDERRQNNDKTSVALLFAIYTSDYGMNMELFQIIRFLRQQVECVFENCVGGILVDGETELYTRSIARDILLAANAAGCLFPGKPIVEGTGSLLNFDVIAGNLGLDYREAYFSMGRDLIERVCDFKAVKWEKPSILVLHASNRDTSNTLAYWSMIKEHIIDCEIQEIHIENGAVVDCIGCPYKACLHYGERGACFYGGVMTEEIYPAISACNALVLLCPNYNDALSANLSAFINRLTALFRTTPFFDKYIYAVIVSGYSGSDIVARQLISAMNINKAFILPPRFAVMDTANNPGSLYGITGIEQKASRFAADIMKITKQAIDVAHLQESKQDET